MYADEYKVMYRVEDFHWWYLGMEAITREIVETRYPRGGPLRILDAGCGTGAVMGYLTDYGTVFGLDYADEALQFSRKRKRQRLAQGSVMRLPYAGDKFDLVASFDVICQGGVTDDAAALHEFARVLRPGGHLVLRLPAAPWLHGNHDIAADVARRYNTAQVEAKLRAAGLEPDHISYANTFLYPVAVVKRLVERFFPTQDGSDLTLGTGPFNGLLRTVLASEAPWVARHQLPFGLTAVALAHKPR